MDSRCTIDKFGNVFWSAVSFFEKKKNKSI